MARTIRTKVFRFNELGAKAKEKAQKDIDTLAKEEYDKFWEGYEEEHSIGMNNMPSIEEWKKNHYDINQFEFTQEGNIFFK